MKNVINTIETATNLVTVNVKFIQGDAILNVANKEMNLNDIKETAESLSIKILTARANLKRYGKKIKGFTFIKFGNSL